LFTISALLRLEPVNDVLDAVLLRVTNDAGSQYVIVNLTNDEGDLYARINIRIGGVNYLGDYKKLIYAPGADLDDNWFHMLIQFSGAEGGADLRIGDKVSSVSLPAGSKIWDEEEEDDIPSFRLTDPNDDGSIDVKLTELCFVDGALVDEDEFFDVSAFEGVFTFTPAGYEGSLGAAGFYISCANNDLGSLGNLCGDETQENWYYYTDGDDPEAPALPYLRPYSVECRYPSPLPESIPCTVYGYYYYYGV
jgi:hypothetical protein